MEANSFNIHFNIIKPINRKKRIITYIVFTILFFVMMYVAIKFLENGLWMMLAYVVLFFLDWLYVEYHKRKIIGEGFINENQITVLDKSYLFKEIDMCWIYFGFKSASGSKDSSFRNFSTIQMTIILDHHNKITFHLLNEISDFYPLSAKLIQLKKQTRSFKLQFHKAQRFEQVEYKRRVDVKNRYLKSLPIRQKRKALRSKNRGK